MMVCVCVRFFFSAILLCTEIVFIEKVRTTLPHLRNSTYKQRNEEKKNWTVEYEGNLWQRAEKKNPVDMKQEHSHIYENEYEKKTHSATISNVEYEQLTSKIKVKEIKMRKKNTNSADDERRKRANEREMNVK